MKNILKKQMREQKQKNKKESAPIKMEIVEEPTKVEESVVTPVDNVNLCFVGGVSTGKSTILNAIFCEQLTQCKIKRTTMVPTIYIENENNPFVSADPEDIYRQIAEKNQAIIERTENGEQISLEEYSELVFHVGKLDINILPDGYVNVYDIPGLNDARTKDVYYEYLESHFQKFNILIFIVDIHSGLNTSDEIDIVNFITRNTRHQLDHTGKKIYTMVIVNKADDMQLDEDSGETDKLCLTGELSEMYDQVEKTVRTEFERKGISDHLIGILPLCAIDSYLYRMVRKHGANFKLSPEQILKIGVNENGKKFSTLKPAVQEKKVYEILNDANFIDTMIKLSGFSCLEKSLHKFLSQTSGTIRVNNLLAKLHLYEDLVRYLMLTDDTIYPKGLEELVAKHDAIYQVIRKIDPTRYDEYVVNTYAAILVTVKDKLAHYTYSKIADLLVDYCNLESNVLAPYFNATGLRRGTYYPEIIQEHLWGLIVRHHSESYHSNLENLMRSFNYLKNVDFCSHATITELLHIFLSNEKLTSDVEDNKLIAFLDQLQDLQMDITALLRYLIIHSLQSQMLEEDGDDKVFVRKMLYQRYDEVPIQNYLLLHMHKLKVSNDTVMKGLQEVMLESPELQLDVYYLRYSKLIFYVD